MKLHRRTFLAGLAGCGLAAAARAEDFKLNYLTASAMYGRLPLDEVLGQIRTTGAAYIDIWREHHANQREQVEKMGHEKFVELLKRHDVRMGATTIWGKPFGDELSFVKKFGGRLLVTGFVPRGNPKKFIEKLKPQIALAEEAGVTVAIENHGANFDQIRAFAEAATSPRVGVALAPYHLPQHEAELARLIEDLGPKLALFYAWQHGMGCTKKLPKEQELLQMPGRGHLDFG
ncbi:MAG: TIM barrel protein, partial [Verrucomicrobiota bacterium]